MSMLCLQFVVPESKLINAGLSLLKLGEKGGLHDKIHSKYSVSYFFYRYTDKSNEHMLAVLRRILDSFS